MKVVGQFNKISDNLKKSIPKLKPGQKVHFRLLDGIYDVASGKLAFGASTTIVCRDVIQDGDEMVTIGVPNIIEKGEVTRVKKFIISAYGENLHSTGLFTLYGGNLEHQEFFEFFVLWNANASNPNRDQSIPARIEMVDEVGEAKRENLVLDQFEKAIVEASQLCTSEAKMREFAQVMNWDVKLDKEVLTNRIKKYARETPDAFLEKLDDPNATIKVLIKEAFDLGIISYQPHEHKVLWAKDGNTLAKLDKPVGSETEVDLLFNWTQASKNGANILKSLGNAVRAAGE